MSVSFTSYYQPKLEAAARRMVEESLDASEISGGLGMVLVRVNSDEHQRRLGADSRIIIFPKVVSVDGQDFIVCEC